jgi:hypothetical protein
MCKLCGNKTWCTAQAYVKDGIILRVAGDLLESLDRVLDRLIHGFAAAEAPWQIGHGDAVVAVGVFVNYNWVSHLFTLAANPSLPAERYCARSLPADRSSGVFDKLNQGHPAGF